MPWSKSSMVRILPGKEEKSSISVCELLAVSFKQGENFMGKILKVFFVIAAIYDAVLGLAFLFFAGGIFEYFAVTPPNHPAYVEFPALLLLIFSWLFLRIAQNPFKERSLIPFGIALKASYCGVAFYHNLLSGIPKMWLPWAWADLVFLLLFVAAWKFTAETEIFSEKN